METTKSNQISNKNNKPVNRHRRGIYIGTIVVLVIIVVTFIGAPILGIGASTQNRIVFGSYNKKEIEYRSGNYFANVYEYLADELNREGPLIDENFYQFQLRQLWRNAFDITVEHVATLDLARESDAVISEEAISKFIIQNPRFQENGKFSVELYRSVGNQEMLSMRNIGKEILLTTQIRDDLLKTIPLSTAEKEFSKEILSDKKTFDFVTFDLDEYPDEAVEEYALSNADTFRSLDLKQITVEDEETAQSVRTQLLNGEESFDSLARLHSVDDYAEQSGAPPVQYAYDLQDLLQDEDVDALFSLAELDYSEVYQTKDDQYIFFQLNAAPVLIEEGNITEEQLETVRDYIRFEDPDVIENYMSDLADAFREDSLSSSMREAAAEYDKEVMTSPALGIDYGNELKINDGINDRINDRMNDGIFPDDPSDDLSFLQTINYRDDFFESLFILKPGEVSEPLLLQRVFVIASLVDTLPATEDEKANIENVYPGLVNDALADYFRTVVVQGDKLKDNFVETYERVLQARPEEEEADTTENTETESEANSTEEQ